VTVTYESGETSPRAKGSRRSKGNRVVTGFETRGTKPRNVVIGVVGTFISLGFVLSLVLPFRGNWNRSCSGAAIQVFDSEDTQIGDYGITDSDGKYIACRDEALVRLGVGVGGLVLTAVGCVGTSIILGVRERTSDHDEATRVNS
jgi:hypothetical protein